MKKKVAFMFGAGAEILKYSMPSGYEFFRKISFPKKNMNLEYEALKSYFNGQYFNGEYKFEDRIVDSYNHFIFNLINSKIENSSEDGNFSFVRKYKTEIESVLTKSNLDILNDTIVKLGLDEKNFFNHLSINKNLENELKEIFENKKKYSQIESCFISSLFDKNEKDMVILDTNLYMGGMLDGYFHTIINPKKYGKVKFNTVFVFYWMCYFTIVESILNLCDKNTREKEFSFIYDDSLTQINYLSILKNIKEFTHKLYETDILKNLKRESSYYELIKKKLIEMKIDLSGILTTNYFKFCECITSSNNIAYLNGKLSYFEIPEELEVRDLCTNSEYSIVGKLFFPFIFGQSLVKPIVNDYQLKEFEKMTRILGKSNLLVILGYNVNEDDNHINSFLHKFLLDDDKKIIIFTNENNIIDKISDKLKCNRNQIVECKVEYSNRDDSIFDKNKKNIENINKLFSIIEQILS